MYRKTMARNDYVLKRARRVGHFGCSLPKAFERVHIRLLKFLPLRSPGFRRGARIFHLGALILTFSSVTPGKSASATTGSIVKAKSSATTATDESMPAFKPAERFAIPAWARNAILCDCTSGILAQPNTSPASQESALKDLRAAGFDTLVFPKDAFRKDSQTSGLPAGSHRAGFHLAAAFSEPIEPDRLTTECLEVTVDTSTPAELLLFRERWQGAPTIKSLRLGTKLRAPQTLFAIPFLETTPLPPHSTDGYLVKAVTDDLETYLAGAPPLGEPSYFARSIILHLPQDPGDPTSHLVLRDSLDAARLHAISQKQLAGGRADDIAARYAALSKLSAVLGGSLPGVPILREESVQQLSPSTTEKEIITTWRGVLSARNKCAALRLGTFVMIEADDEDDMLAFARLLKPSKPDDPPSAAIVIINTAPRMRHARIQGTRLTAKGAKAGTILTRAVATSRELDSPLIGANSPGQITITSETLSVPIGARSALLYTSPN